MNPTLFFAPRSEQCLRFAALLVFSLLALPTWAQNAYVPNSFSNDVSVIATASNTVLTTVPVGASPVGAAVSPDGSRVYITNFNASTVSVLATATNTVLITVPVGFLPRGVAVSPDGSRVYVANYGSNDVSVLATTSNTVLTTVPVGASPQVVAVSPDGSRVYVANQGSDNVSVINTATNTVLTTVPVDDYPKGVAVSPDGSRVYVANALSNSVSVITTASNTVLTTVPVGNYPRGVAVSPDGSRVYVTNSAAGTVSVIATASNTVLTTVTVGNSPIGLDFTPDGSRVYVANNSFANVSVIATASNTVLTTVPVGSGPIALGKFIGPRSCSAFNSTPTVSQVPACAGATVRVSFTIHPTPDCSFPVGNGFRAELSDATGSFAAPVNLGTVSPGINNVTIPQSTPTGTGYRMRILATTPGLVSFSASSAAFTVNQPSFASTPTVSLDNRCPGEAVRLSFAIKCSFFAGNTFTAYLSDASGAFPGGGTSLGTVTPGALNNVTIPLGTVAGTTYKIRVVSSNPVVTSAASANFKVKACGNTREAAPEDLGLQVRVSPNPSPEGRLRIHVSGAEGQALKVALFNGTGQPVREQAIDRASEEEALDWDISRQPQGLYLLRVSSGKEAKTVKVVH